MKWEEIATRDTDEELFYHDAGVMVLALCQVWVNDVTAEGITFVTKLVRSGVVFKSSVTPPIREVEDRIVYARDKLVELSVINQFASTWRQPGNYDSPFYRELWNHSSRGSWARARTGDHLWKVDRAPILRWKVVTAEQNAALLNEGKRGEAPNGTDEWIISVDTRKSRQPRPWLRGNSKC